MTWVFLPWTFVTLFQNWPTEVSPEAFKLKEKCSLVWSSSGGFCALALMPERKSKRWRAMKWAAFRNAPSEVCRRPIHLTAWMHSWATEQWAAFNHWIKPPWGVSAGVHTAGSQLYGCWITEISYTFERKKGNKGIFSFQQFTSTSLWLCVYLKNTVGSQWCWLVPKELY